ncbi:hypothetical protein LSH36_291g08051 [Paralvinella palmiformis]|uniref:Innexin n=1 Tax=Paralvinella palmiformis TaxID=53620 RepID=A0AAD9JJ39_9ANNE|nr:hypothetical protein LSH36_291g08051 [Paralvinella palmiformis]
MDVLFRVIRDLKEVKFRLDDDLPDRLSRRYTCSFLLLFAVLVSVRQYWGEAIHCWCPEVCAANHEKYANIYCWVSDTYYVAFDDEIPQPGEPREKKIVYYQWTPIILISQAVLFFLPCTLWRLLNGRSGINIGVVMEAAVASQRADYADSRDKMLRYAVHLLDRFLLTQRSTKRGCYSRLKHVLSKHCFLVYGRLYGNYLTFCYVVIKLLYVANAVGQLFMLDVILGYEYHLFGVHVMRHLLFGEEWIASDKFPRVTLCDYKIRQNTNVHQYTVQCVLPINLFNEKIFAIVWFWFLFVGIVTLLSLFQWLIKLTFWPNQMKFIKRQLRAMDSFQREPAILKRFVENYLRRDGMFILRMVAKNAGNPYRIPILSVVMTSRASVVY